MKTRADSKLKCSNPARGLVAAWLGVEISGNFIFISLFTSAEAIKIELKLNRTLRPVLNDISPRITAGCSAAVLTRYECRFEGDAVVPSNQSAVQFEMELLSIYRPRDLCADASKIFFLY